MDVQARVVLKQVLSLTSRHAAKVAAGVAGAGRPQLGLFADRTSAATMRANQLRVYFASFAYVLMHSLRRLGLAGTHLARAQCTTIRLKLLKIGARLRISVRKVWLSFSESYPYASDFAQVLANLRCYPAWARPG